MAGVEFGSGRPDANIVSPPRRLCTIGSSFAAVDNSGVWLLRSVVALESHGHHAPSGSTDLGLLSARETQVESSAMVRSAVGKNSFPRCGNLLTSNRASTSPQHKHKR